MRSLNLTIATSRLGAFFVLFMSDLGA